MIKSIVARFPVIGAGLAITSFVGTSLLVNNAVHAVTSKECHQQFTAAKKAGTVKEKTFREFKAANCKDERSVKDEMHQQDVKKSDTFQNNASSKSPAKQDATASSIAAGDAVFPNAVDSKYSNEKEGTARMHTCLDQYKANKADNKNGNLKWIQKGGGYYSDCMKHFKSGSAQ